MADIARLSMQIDVNGAQRARQALQGLQDGSIRATRATDGLVASTVRMNAATRRTTGAFRVQKGAIQQVGFQVGDFATQVSAGQSAIVAFGQQASQLAGIMGPGGALLGAVIAIGAGIAGAFVRGMGSGSDAVSALSEALDETSESLDRTENSAFELTERIREMAKVSQASARIELNAQLVKIDNAINGVGSSLRQTFSENGDFGSAISIFDQLSRAGESTGAVMTALESSLRGVDANLTDEYTFLAEALNGVRDEFGLTRNQSILFLDSLKQINDEPTEENLKLLVGRLNAIQESSESTTPQFALMASEVSGVATEALRLIERGESLDGILDDLTDALSKSGDEAGKSAEKIREMVQAAEQQAATMGLSARAEATYEAALAGANAEQILAIDTAFRRIEAYNQEQEAIKKTAKEERERIKQRQQQEQALASMRAQADPAFAEFNRYADQIDQIEQFNITAEEKERLREAAFAQHQQRMAQIAQEGTNQKTRALEQSQQAFANSQQQIQQMTASVFGNTVGVMREFAEEGSAAWVALTLAQKGIMAAQAIMAANLAAAMTRTAIITPLDPSSPARAEAQAQAIRFLGIADAAAIMATGVAETAPSFAGGGFTGEGSRSGGVDGKGGFPAILHPNETVIDHTMGQGMGGNTYIEVIDQSTGQKTYQHQSVMDASGNRQVRLLIRDMMREDIQKGEFDKQMQTSFGVRRRARRV